MLHITNNPKQAKDFQIGDRFILKARGYYHDKQSIEFTVTRVNEDSIHFTDATGDVDYTLTDVAMTVYGNNLQIVERTSDNNAINAVSVRLLGSAMGKERKEFEKTFNALRKAEKEFRENKTIKFENGRLTFVSRDSGEQRNVTKFGCDFNTCPCQNQMSYHSVLFAICEHVAKGVLPESTEVFAAAQSVAA